jgi:hypothetical protein
MLHTFWQRNIGPGVVKVKIRPKLIALQVLLFLFLAKLDMACSLFHRYS